MPPADELARTLARLYAEQLALSPHDHYLLEHADPRVIATQVRVFRWYVPLLGDCLAPNARVMDWGCRHAPDSCLLRAAFGHTHCLSATDLQPPGRFDVFHRFAQIEYRPLDCVFRLPFPDASLDAVIGSGTLEHAAQDYESLKEIWRVLRLGGRAVFTYLPNRWSVGEWWRRNVKKEGYHPRLYSLGQFREMLLHHGFRPVAVGHQTTADVLPGGAGWRWAARAVGAHRFTSTLCAVAEKVAAME